MQVLVNDTYNPRWKYQNPNRYHVTFSQIPKVENDKIVYSRAEFSNKKTAFKFASVFSEYLNDLFVHLDLIYFRLKSISEYDCNINQTKKSYLQQLIQAERCRNKIVCAPKEKDFAHNYIIDLSNYFDSLKIVIPYYFTSSPKLANSLFRQLLLIENNLASTVKSAVSLFESNQLMYLI